MYIFVDKVYTLEDKSLKNGEIWYLLKTMQIMISWEISVFR